MVLSGAPNGIFHSTLKAPFGTTTKANNRTTPKSRKCTETMAKPSEKLAESLQILLRLQENGRSVLRTGDLSRTHRERLSRNGFLKQVMRGWYIPLRPEDPAGFTG